MPETHDVGRTRFFQMFRYPGTRRLRELALPIREHGVDVREIDVPYRIGAGTSTRLPGTRWALIWGRWIDRGGDEEERLVAALRSHVLEDSPDEISGW